MRDNRIFAPLDVEGLRLYKVVVCNQDGQSAGFELVMAHSPRGAAGFIKRAYGPHGRLYTFQGYAQRVHQPREWTE